MVINFDLVFNGVYFQVEMLFSEDYFYFLFKFCFLNLIIYFNVYFDGQFCILILYMFGEDVMFGELVLEWWILLYGVESVLRLVLLLLDDFEIGFFVNVDVGVMYWDWREEYNRKVKEMVEYFKIKVFEGFEMLRSFESVLLLKMENDDGFW